MGIMVSVLSGKSFRTEAVSYDGKLADAYPCLKGTVVLSVWTDNGELSLHLTPRTAAMVEATIGQCLKDRAVMLATQADNAEEVELTDADAVDKSIADGVTDDDRKAMSDLGGSVGC